MSVTPQLQPGSKPTITAREVRQNIKSLIILCAVAAPVLSTVWQHTANADSGKPSMVVMVLTVATWIIGWGVGGLIVAFYFYRWIWRTTGEGMRELNELDNTYVPTPLELLPLLSDHLGRPVGLDEAVSYHQYLQSQRRGDYAGALAKAVGPAVGATLLGRQASGHHIL